MVSVFRYYRLKYVDKYYLQLFTGYQKNAHQNHEPLPPNKWDISIKLSVSDVIPYPTYIYNICRMDGITHQYQSPGPFRFDLFPQLRTIYKPANEQQVRSKASTMLKSWLRIANIDPFFVTNVLAVANVSFSLNVCAIPVKNK